MSSIQEWDKLPEERKESILDLVRSFNLGAEPVYLHHLHDGVDMKEVWSCYGRYRSPKEFEEMYLSDWSPSLTVDPKDQAVSPAKGTGNKPSVSRMTIKVDGSVGLGTPAYVSPVMVSSKIRYFVCCNGRVGINQEADKIIIFTPNGFNPIVDIYSSPDPIGYFVNNKNWTEVSCINERILSQLPHATAVNSSLQGRWDTLVREIQADHKKSSVENIAPVKPTHLPKELDGCTVVSPTEVMLDGKTFIKDSVNVWKESITLIPAESYILSRRALG